MSSSETGAGRQEILDYIGSVLESLGKDKGITPQKAGGESAEKTDNNQNIEKDEQ